MSGVADNALGLYLSIPFCRSKCTYCNFASGVYPASQHERYVDRVIEDLHGAPAWAAEINAELPRLVDTIYLGGGTPSLLAPELVSRLFDAIRAAFTLDADAEITMECAPGQISDATLDAMVAAGVNRVSLGVQSFIDREAQSSGRLHNRAIVEQDLHRLRQAGVTNLNVDLIAGLAGQTFDSWQQSLTTLIDSGMPHASVYMLEVDEDSRLGRELLAGGTRYRAELVPTDEAIARMYEHAIERLSGAEIKQYEISNFAAPHFQSRHNLRYWQRRPYLGLGLDASSALYARQEERQSNTRFLLRTKTTDALADYLAGPQPVETAWLSPARQHEEAWFLGLRLNAGVSVTALEDEFGREMIAPALKAAERMIEAGLLSSEAEIIHLTGQGRLLSNDVFQEFLELAGETAAAR
jgi:oxygen-independent coproporphyrinogen-3 oxidase